MATLLEKARNFDRVREREVVRVPNDEEADLIIAFLNGQLSSLQVASVLNISPSNVMTRIAKILCLGVRGEKITISKVK